MQYPPLSFDIVIVTRNRASSLRLSIPLQLSQSRKPGKLVVVDSSDDHEQTRRAVEEASQGFSTPVECIKGPRGTTLQRNVGLTRVTAPIVFFPDDDALWHPGVAEAIMRIYERDVDGVIGAVCGAETRTAPGEMIAVARSTYKMRWTEKLKQKVGYRRVQIENRFFQNPFTTHGQSRWSVQPVPTWLAEENASLVEWMTGFRMSFRTDAVRKYGFDEALTQYAVFEDVDASFQVMKDKLIVGARNARVFHYKAREGRGSGVRLGATQLLMRNYVICKHSPPGSLARSQLRRYARYKCFQYVLQIYSKFGRDRTKGAWRALKWTDRFLNCPPDQLTALYLRAIDECTAS